MVALALQEAPRLDPIFLDRLVETIKSHDVQGVCLAGSAANDELLWARTPEGFRLLSDVEVGVIAPGFRERTAIKVGAKAVGEPYGYDVEVFLVTPGRLKRGSPKNLSFRPHAPNLFMYDFINSAKWLYRTGDLEIPELTPERIPPWEGIRLILNRLGEGAPFLLPWFAGDPPPADEDELQRWILKLLMALGDAALAARGDYRTGYLNRAAVLEKRVASGTIDLDGDMVETIQGAYRTRRGEDFDATAIDRTRLRTETRRLLGRLLSRHSGNRLAPDDTQWLTAQRAWAGIFQQTPIPVRYQAPVAALDALYDSLFTLSKTLRRGIRPSIAGAALAHRVPVQVIGYGVIASCLAGTPEEGAANCNAQLSRYLPAKNEESLGESLKRWWSAACV